MCPFIISEKQWIMQYQVKDKYLFLVQIIIIIDVDRI